MTEKTHLVSIEYEYTNRVHEGLDVVSPDTFNTLCYFGDAVDVANCYKSLSDIHGKDEYFRVLDTKIYQLKMITNKCHIE